MKINIRSLNSQEAKASIEALSTILIDCVEGGASVSFMLPITKERADRFWESVAEGVENGERVLLVAEDASTKEMIGTVQLVLCSIENQPHRGDVSKMLVSRKARMQGVGTALMQAVEEESKKAKRSVLILDTVTNSAGYRLYSRMGWEKVGDIPNYALWPQGGLCSTTYFHKQIAL